ncbi:MAG: hypothetical protein RLO80_09590 [Hyphomonas sp.]
MGRILRAFIATLLIIEIAAIFLGTSTWAILSELHASMPVILGGEAIAGLAIIALAVVVFQRALAAERRIDEKLPSDA